MNVFRVRKCVQPGQAAIVAAALVGGILTALPLDAAERAGQPVENFTLRDDRGAPHSLSDFSDQKLVVIAVLGTECPLAKLYAPRLEELAREYEPRGVAFIGLNANSQDTLAEIAAYARQHDITFPVLKDNGQQVADRLGAERTPEVFVLDDQRQVRYRGRIDDQYLPGQQRSAPEHRDLATALDELLAGKDVTTPHTEVVGCYIGRDSKPDPKLARSGVTYSNQIARLVQAHCQECHRAGEAAPFPLESYADAQAWAETIREVVADERMPPWSASAEHGVFRNDARLSDAEKRQLFDWIDDGCPEGDASQLPPPREFARGWQISQPDEVYYIADKPVDVPAEGAVKYRYYTVDPGWTEDKWIAEAEARPDNRAVVHHIVVMFRGEKLRDAGGMIGYAPGMPPARHQAGAALYVPAGAKLVFQMHYTPNGAPQKDRSYVGFKFADPSQVTHRVYGAMVINRKFVIPPGADDFEVTSEMRIPKPMLLTSLMPHMHLRGKSFRYEVEYPDQRREMLLDVPRYDFNWQLRYELAEPKFVPAGSKLTCTAHYDNSADNLVNPDPSQEVRWGDQTWEEMMIGYFSAVSPLPDGPAAGAAVRDKVRSWLDVLKGL